MKRQIPPGVPKPNVRMFDGRWHVSRLSGSLDAWRHALAMERWVDAVNWCRARNRELEKQNHG